MLTYLHLENFKSFTAITLDLRKARGEAKNLAFIYGENGSGKSHLILAVNMLKESLSSLDRLAEVKRIGSQAHMVIEIGFRLKHQNGSYRMVFDKEQIIEETLYYLIGKRQGVLYKIDQKTSYFSPTIFFDTHYKKELQKRIRQHFGQQTAMALIAAENPPIPLNGEKGRVGFNLLVVLKWLETLSVSSDDFQQRYNPLEHGKVNTEDDRVLLKNQEQLNEYLTQVFSDVKSIHYQLTANENRYTYELILTQQIEGELIDIPISQESSGTRKLLNLFPYLFKAARGDTVVIDAIDQGIHELLMLEVLEALKDSLKGQLIVTTHNTLLLKEMEPEEAYIVVIDAKGHKEIRCITDYRERTQKAHNMQHKYLRGDYEGIPYVGAIDFSDFWEGDHEQPIGKEPEQIA